ncbi:hypothetical protein LLH00_00400, partial [bacterium]|nr:hypothetical protein [bacterium]
MNTDLSGSMATAGRKYLSGVVLGVAALLATWAPTGLRAQAGGLDGPETPRILSVRMLPTQPQAAAASTIWYDDFSSDRTEYTERQNDLDTRVGFGGQGGSLPCVYDKGSQ